jgi:hypothetical protein
MARVSEPFPSPTVPADSRTAVFLRHLDIVTELATGVSGE